MSLDEIQALRRARGWSQTSETTVFRRALLYPHDAEPGKVSRLRLRSSGSTADRGLFPLTATLQLPLVPLINCRWATLRLPFASVSCCCLTTLRLPFGQSFSLDHIRLNTHSSCRGAASQPFERFSRSCPLGQSRWVIEMRPTQNGRPSFPPPARHSVLTVG